jgi:hypothetical protein
MSKTIANVRVGEPDVKATAPSHVRGIRGGNTAGDFERQQGIYHKGLGARGTARRSTGIDSDARNPIDPRMPNLSPA